MASTDEKKETQLMYVVAKDMSHAVEQMEDPDNSIKSYSFGDSTRILLNKKGELKSSVVAGEIDFRHIVEHPEIAPSIILDGKMFVREHEHQRAEMTMRRISDERPEELILVFRAEIDNSWWELPDAT